MRMTWRDKGAYWEIDPPPDRTKPLRLPKLPINTREIFREKVHCEEEEGTEVYDLSGKKVIYYQTTASIDRALYGVQCWNNVPNKD